MTQPASNTKGPVPIDRRWEATEDQLQLEAPPAAAGALTAAAEVHTGAMIALVPTDADGQRIAVDGGEPVDQLHVTLMYLGEGADFSQAARDAIVSRLEAMVEDAVKPDYDLPLQADGFAVSVFNPGTVNDRETCIVLGLSGADLDAVHGMTVDCVGEVQADDGGFELPDQHAPWVPHLTLIYTDDIAMVEELTDRVGPIKFDRLRVAFAGDVIDIPLDALDTEAQTSTGDSMGDKARTATAAGTTQTVDAAAGITFQTECPPGSHMMPDGSCMSDEDMAAEQGAVPPPAPVPPGEHFHTIVTEGVSTGMRTFRQDGLTWREPPFAFHYEYSAAAHGGLMMTKQVGLITRVERDGADIHMWGPLDLDEPLALEFARKLVQGYSRWTSVGLDETAEVEFIWPESEGEDGEGGDLFEMLFADPEQVMITGTICEATAVSTPALSDAKIEPTQELIDLLKAKGIIVASAGADMTAVAVHHTPTAEGEWDGPANEARLDSPCELATARAAYAWIDMDRVDADMVPKDACKFIHHDVDGNGNPGDANLSACSTGIGILNGGRGGADIPDGDRQGVYDHLAAHLRDADREPPELAHLDDGETAEAAVLTAASYTVTINELPPAWWFEEPIDVSPDLAFTVTDRGRVFGFIAPRDIPHRSFPNRTVTVPIDRVDFSKWMKHNGAMTDLGPVKAGPITMSCGHANPHSTDYAGRVEHYDNTCSIVAYAAAGVARDRIWVGGGLLPGVTADQIARMWASRLSGDWQPHREKPGWQEFIAALLVPTPGFAGSSDQLRPPQAQAMVRTKGGLLVASAVPVRYEVTQAPQPEPDMRPALDSIARHVGLDPAARMMVLRRRIGA